MFQQLALKVDYMSRKFGMTLSGRSYITCRNVLAAKSRDALPDLQQLAWNKCRVRTYLCQMIDTMYFE